MKLICSTCGTQTDKGKKVTPGSFIVELALWMFFGVGLIYTLWRISARFAACGTCGSKDLIPTGSPAGRKLVSETDVESIPDIAA